MSQKTERPEIKNRSHVRSSRTLPTAGQTINGLSKGMHCPQSGYNEENACKQLKIYLTMLFLVNEPKKHAIGTVSFSFNEM
jgi:hypothetical protein